MLDIRKPLVTTTGESVTILSDKARFVVDNKSYPLVGYIRDSSVPAYWDVTWLVNRRCANRTKVWEVW